MTIKGFTVSLESQNISLELQILELRQCCINVRYLQLGKLNNIWREKELFRCF